MKKGRELLNLPVIDVSNGQIVGKVKEIIIGEKYLIKGLIISSDNDRQYEIGIEEVQSIGRDAVLLHSWQERPISEITVDSLPNYTGSLVLTDTGRNVGMVKDVVLHEEGRQVAAFEISDGHLKDLIMGRTIIPVEEVMQYGTGAIIISDIEQGDEL